MPPKNNQPSDVKQKIFEEAIRLFGESGFEGTSIQTIADAVGIRKPSLLYHFSSKEELREAVIDDLITDWTAEMPRLLTEARSGHDRFSSTITALVEFFLRDPNRARLVIREMMDRPDQIGALARERIGPWTKILVDYIHMGQGSRLIKPTVDPEAYLGEVLMMVICTVAMGSGVSKLLGSEDEAIETKIDELVRIARDALFVRTLRKKE